MESRAQELRAKGRRIFWFSMVGAAAIHGVIFVALQRQQVARSASGTTGSRTRRSRRLWS